MKYGYSDEDFLAKCRDIDFSADSQNYEENLDALKGKLAQALEKEKYIMNKSRKFRKPIALIATLVVALSLSVVAFGDTIWNYIEYNIIKGGEHINHLNIMSSPVTVVDHEDGHSTAFGITKMELDIDPDAEGPIIVEIEGEEFVLQDTHHFYDLNEALGHFSGENPLLPAYLPDSFAFERATFTVSPVRHPDDSSASNSVRIFYGNGQDQLSVNITNFTDEVILVPATGNEISLEDFDIDTEGLNLEAISFYFIMMSDSNEIEKIEINDQATFVSDEMLVLSIGNTVYTFSSDSLTNEQLIQIAESLQ